MKLKAFLEDPNKIGTLMPLIANGKLFDAKRYIIGWTDCSMEEAEDTVSNIVESVGYKLYLKETAEAKENLAIARKKDVFWKPARPVSSKTSCKNSKTGKKTTINKSVLKTVSPKEEKGTLNEKLKRD